MKHIVIGDIHAKKIWREVLERHKNETVHYVFLGDYFDSWDKEPSKEQIDNFNEICSITELEPDRFTMLIGNHDYQYLPCVNERYSGYQKDGAKAIGSYLNLAASAGTIKMAYSWNSFLFTHAGVTNSWLQISGLKEYDDVDITARHINILFENDLGKFSFFEGDSSGFGEHVNQSPIWVRPKSLMSDCSDSYSQVVGHTRVELPEIKLVNGRFIVLNDALDRNGYCSIDDSGVVTRLSL